MKISNDVLAVEAKLHGAELTSIKNIETGERVPVASRSERLAETSATAFPSSRMLEGRHVLFE